MRHIIDTPEGAIVIHYLIENCCDPFDFFFEIDSIPPSIEKKLDEGIKIAKQKRFTEIIKESPNRFKTVGYESADQIPEYIIATGLNLKFSDRGNGLECSNINRYIVDNLDSDYCNFEAETSLFIDLSEQIQDIKQLALTYLEKIMFQKRVAENYIL